MPNTMFPHVISRVFTPTLMRNVRRDRQGVARWRCVCSL